MGDLYKDTSTGTIYKCTAVDSSTPAYTWSEFGAGGETVDAYTKTETDTLLSQKQNTLTAGDNITITDDGTISATGGDVDLTGYLKNTATGTEGAIAIGDSSTGSGRASTALGAGSSASSANTVAIGHGAAASGSAAVVVGTNASAEPDYTVAVGAGAIVSSGGDCAFGNGAYAQATAAQAFGNGAKALSSNSIAIGYNAKTSSSGLVAIGHNSAASAINAMAFGYGAKAQGSSSLAIGNVTASGGGAIAIGSSNKAGGSNSISVGGSINNTSGQYSLRIGYNARQVSEYDLTGNYGIGIGYNAYTTNQYGIAIGSNANVKADYGIQLGRGSNSDANTFKVGLSDTLNVELLSADGTIPASRLAEIMIVSDTALGDLYKDTSTGTIYKCTAVDSSTPAYTWSEFGAGGGETIDAYTKTETDTLLSQKQNTLTAGDGITIVDNVISASGGGLTNNSTDDRSLSVGEGATASDPSNTVYRGSTAFGYEASANNKSSTALGAHSSVNGSSGVAVGSLAESDSSGVAVGWQAFAHDHCVSIGHNAASQNGSLYGTAVGCSSFTSDNYCVALGNDASAYGIGSIAIGSGASALDHTYDDTDSNTIVIGHNASSGSGCITIGEGANTTSVFYDPGDGSEPNFISGENAIAIGKNAQAAGKNTIQLGSAENTDAGTFKVCLGESGTNYMLLDASGNIPAERLVNAPGGMEILSGTDYPNPEMVGEVGQVYIKTDDETAYMCTGVIAAEESTGTTYSYTWKEISYIAPIQTTVSVSSGNLPPDNMTSGNPGDIYIEIIGEFDTSPKTYVPYICTNYDLETGETTWAKIVSKNYAPGSYVDDFVVAASGSEYTALSDGFVWATRDDSQGWVQLRNKETLLSSGTIIANYGSLFLPVSAGDKFTLEYYEGTVTLKMVASKGE